MVSRDAESVFNQMERGGLSVEVVIHPDFAIARLIRDRDRQMLEAGHGSTEALARQHLRARLTAHDYREGQLTALGL